MITGDYPCLIQTQPIVANWSIVPATFTVQCCWDRHTLEPANTVQLIDMAHELDLQQLSTGRKHTNDLLWLRLALEHRPQVVRYSQYQSQYSSELQQPQHSSLEGEHQLSFSVVSQIRPSTGHSRAPHASQNTASTNHTDTIDTVLLSVSPLRRALTCKTSTGSIVRARKTSIDEWSTLIAESMAKKLGSQSRRVYHRETIRMCCVESKIILGPSSQLATKSLYQNTHKPLMLVFADEHQISADASCAKSFNKPVLQCPKNPSPGTKIDTFKLRTYEL